MRSITELLEVMYENKEALEMQSAPGLCRHASNLLTRNLISYEEWRLLDIYIETHRPSVFSSLAAWQYRKDSYYWPPYDYKNRIKWIKQHIKKTQKTSH